MTALSADSFPRMAGPAGQRNSYLVEASEIIYKGAIVGIDGTDGYAQAGDDAAAMAIVGIADEQCDNSAGADAAKSVAVLSDVTVRLTQDGNITQAMVGGLATCLDDGTVSEAGTTTPSDNIVGRIVARESATAVWVYIPGGGSAGL